MKIKILAVSTVLAAGWTLGCMSVAAATITLQQGINGYTGYTDTTVRSDNPTINYNNTTNGLYLGETLVPATIRGLMNFDVSVIPDGATINSVTLTLTSFKKDDTSNPYAYQLNLVSLNTLFTDASANWNTTNGTTAWTTAGGDIGTTALSSVNLDPTSVAALSTTTFASSSALVTLVQSAVNGSNNLSLALKLASETPDVFRKVYFFYDSTGGAYAPSLTIDYTVVPEPTAYYLMLMGACVVLFVRRTRREASAQS